MLEIQATDYDFLASFGELFKAGFAAGEDAALVAAFVLHAADFYDQDRMRCIDWIRRTAREFAERRTPA
jgi:hypothetical protein